MGKNSFKDRSTNNNKFKGKCNKGNYCGVRVHRTAQCKLVGKLSAAEVNQINMKGEAERLRVERELEGQAKIERIKSDFLDLPYSIDWEETIEPVTMIIDGSMSDLRVLKETAELDNGMVIERKSLTHKDEGFYWHSIWDCEVSDIDESKWVDYYMAKNDIDEDKRTRILEIFESEIEYFNGSLNFEYSESGGHAPNNGLYLTNPEILHDLNEEISNFLEQE